MNKIYIGKGYPVNANVEPIIAVISNNLAVTSEHELADIFLFPVFYEVLFEYNDVQREANGYSESNIDLLKVKFADMVSKAVTGNKKIIVFYYRDPIDKIPVPNVVVFRTSILKSNRDNNEFSLPAFINEVSNVGNIDPYLEKQIMPTVAFRGQAAPLKLPTVLGLKKNINELLNLVNVNKKIPLHYNFGYMARRDAMLACSGNKKIKTDFTITTDKDIADPKAKNAFLNNLFSNAYNICVSGHGNYSYRLYETLCAGRIPVFVNTDCVLPFEEFIDWKKHVVWIEENEVHKTDKIILDFHQAIHPDDFLSIQKENRMLWENYLTKDAFFAELYKYIPLIK